MGTMEQSYIHQMEEIKRRTESIEKVTSFAHGNLYLPVATESVYLQFRKILELIAMSTLVANKDAMEAMGRSMKKLGTQWNGDHILKCVEDINRDFYPIPIHEKEPSDPRAKRDLVEKPSPYLTRDRFAELYNRWCGPALHADNPFRAKTDYQKLWETGPTWLGLITTLLSCHQVKLVGHKGFHLVHMHEEQDGKVHMYEFVPQ